jgi:hypothetical protein
MEDLDAALEAFRDDSFDNVNIFSNRIMSDATLIDTNLFLLGFFLKDVAFTFGLLKTRQMAMPYSTAKSHGFKFIELLRKSPSSFDEEKLWKEFHKYKNVIRKFEMNEFENKSYSNNIDFTKKAFSWLFDYLKTNKEVLLDSQNLLLKGILNEMHRIFRVNSGNLSEIILMSLTEALDRYYEYVRRIYSRPDARIEEEKVQKDIFPYISQIEKACFPKINFSEVHSILWNLVKGWRELFIQRMELLPLRVSFEKGVEMPEELKKRLSEGMTKILEKET